MVQRAGFPAVTDVAAQYRLHADQVANGEKARPVKALLIEVDANGVLNPETFGIPTKSHREVVAFLAECSRAIAEAIRTHNACASN